MTAPKSENVLTSPRLRRALWLTGAGLWAERLAAAFWPLLSLLLFAGGVMSLGLLASLSQPVLLALLAVTALAGLTLLIFGLRRFERPNAARIRARLDATLPGRPLAALADDQAVGARDPASAALWQAHRARMARLALTARAPRPHANMSARDPYALRLTALLLAVMGFAFGSPARLTELPLAGAAGPATAAPGPVWEGWIRPPAYTGRPPLYLNALETEGLEIPQGAEVVLRFYGSDTALSVTETVSGNDTAGSTEFTIRQHGEITIHGPGGRSWQIGVLPDTAPLIAASAVPERQADGSFKLPFTASDDYGVLKAEAEITLDLARIERRYGLVVEPEPRPAIALDLPLPFSGKRADLKGVLQDDLASHPFANLPVIIRLRATDAAGQTGQSEPLYSLLPGRRFFDPLAGAVAEVRRDLLWNISNARPGAQLLRAAIWSPENFIRNDSAYRRLRNAIWIMERRHLTAEVRDSLAEELLAIAVLFEEGDLTSALERLQRAQDRLDEAMRNGASQSEIQELMDELRQALDAYMEQLAKESEREPKEQNGNTEGLEMSADQLQQMLDKLEQLMAEGKMAEAQELMEMLRELMENMQVTQGEGGQGRGEGQGAMRDLGETLRRQQDLSDEAFRDLQRRYDTPPGDQGQQGQTGEGQDQGEGQGEARSLEERQRDLRNQLRALGQTEMPGDGGPEADAGRQSLDRSREAMEGAEEALRDGDLPRALDRQAEAIESLREGMRSFEEAEARENGTRRPGESEGGDQAGEGEGQGGEGRDPLGRQAGRSGSGGTEEGMADGVDPYRRALDLLEELRRRQGEQFRPEEERDYLRRLLDQF